MKKGFTLIELIIVVIILGVLGTIAIPQYLNAVERGRIGKARSALTMIAKAEKMYAAEHGGAYLAVGAAAIGDPCLTTAPGADLSCYIELVDIAADPDWDYSTTIAAGTFTATAAKVTGQTGTITLTNAGVWGGTHPLR